MRLVQIEKKELAFFGNFRKSVYICTNETLEMPHTGLDAGPQPAADGAGRRGVARQEGGNLDRLHVGQGCRLPLYRCAREALAVHLEG